MSESEKVERLASAGEERSSPKRPYEKPTVRHDQVFETRALSCGKVQTSQWSCQHNRKS